jgi:hypothetical protein
MHAQAHKRSSTSSFERGLTGEILKTLLVLLALPAELVLRAGINELSRNSSIIGAHPERAQRIAAEQSRPSILILGNSMSGHAIDAQLLAEELRRRGADVLVEHQPADSTAMRDWYLELKNMFVAAGAVPDWLILPVGDARELTRINPRTEDLAHFFLANDDIASLFELDGMHRFEDRAAVHLARLSTLYCYRGRIQKRLLDAFVPGYAELRQVMNTSGPPADESDGRLSTAWADLMRDLTQQHDIRPIVVALPTQHLANGLLPSERELAERAGWHILEPGTNAVWTSDDVPDGLHLSEPARERFTRLLAPPLADLLTGPRTASVVP